jgi:endoglucanase
MLASSSSQWNPWLSSSSAAITAIHEVLPASVQNKAPRIRQNGHKLYVEKNGKRFDLLGNSIR